MEGGHDIGTSSLETTIKNKNIVLIQHKYSKVKRKIYHYVRVKKF